jgi:hypothetical protein
MRILVVDKYHYLRSGTERCLFNVRRLLEWGIVAGIVHGHVCRRRRSVVAR